MADRLPVLGRGIGITRGPQHHRREEEQDDHHRQEKNDDGEDQQPFVPGDDEKGTLEQLPAPLKPAHYVHGISFVRMNVIGSRLFGCERLESPVCETRKSCSTVPDIVSNNFSNAKIPGATRVYRASPDGPGLRL
jgi:hypothetical protein